jgi:hypothetical protein
LALHPHVHCLVSGGGLTVHGSWQPVRTGFLLPVAVVGALEEVWLTGRLVVPPYFADDGVRQVLVEAARPKWNIRIAQRSPHGRGVVKYLARYVRGGPIKEQRLVAFDGEQVTLWYGNHQDLDKRGQPCQAELTLDVREFLRRWSEHIPLAGVHTGRAWGRYASTQRQKLECCRAQLPEEEALPEPPRVVKEEPPRDRDHPWERCPVCHQRMVVTQVVPRAGAPPRVEPWPVAA